MRLAQMQDRMTAVQRQASAYDPDVRLMVEQFLIMGEMVARGGAADWNYRTYQDLIVDLGEVKRQEFYVPDDAMFVEAEPQMCYYNSFNIVSDQPLEYTYCEGFAQTTFMVVRHAWVEDRDGRIIDPTWAHHLNYEPDVRPTYYGIKFSADFVIERATTTGWTSIFEREWSYKPDCPSLRFGFTTNKAGVVTGYKESA